MGEIKDQGEEDIHDLRVINPNYTVASAEVHNHTLEEYRSLLESRPDLQAAVETFSKGVCKTGTVEGWDWAPEGHDKLFVPPVFVPHISFHTSTKKKVGGPGLTRQR